MSDVQEPRRPSERGIINMAYVLANGGAVPLSALSDSDARAVWRVIRDIMQWRRDLGHPQPVPKGEPKAPLTPAQIRNTVVRLGGEDPNAIVAEIMAEPLLQASLWALAAMMNLPFPTLGLSVTAPASGEDGP